MMMAMQAMVTPAGRKEKSTDRLKSSFVLHCFPVPPSSLCHQRPVGRDLLHRAGRKVSVNMGPAISRLIVLRCTNEEQVKNSSPI